MISVTEVFMCLIRKHHLCGVLLLRKEKKRFNILNPISLIYTLRVLLIIFCKSFTGMFEVNKMPKINP